MDKKVLRISVENMQSWDSVQNTYNTVELSWSIHWNGKNTGLRLIAFGIVAVGQILSLDFVADILDFKRSH